MDEKVIKYMEKNELIHKNSKVIVGVSGGPDSMALLHFYISIKKSWNLEVIAVSADHQLRGAESREDLKYVEQMCKQWEVPLIKSYLDVKGYKEKHQVSTQVAARRSRYEFFRQQMNETKADYLALGHHGDDQVETMLMAFVRSTSTTAFSGIPVKRKFEQGFVVRPFLCINKLEIMDYCEKHEIQPRIDPSNKDIDYTRNYFRELLIPIIKEKNNNIHTTVQRLSESLQTDEVYLRKKAKKLVNSVVNFSKKDNEASFKINDFKSYPLSLQRRSYHLILNYLYKILPMNLSYVHEDIFFSLLDEHKGNIVVDFPEGLKVEKVYDEMNFSFKKPSTMKTDYNIELAIPGKVNLPNNKALISSYTNKFEKGNHKTFIFSAENVELPLRIRTRKPGDRMSWEGLGGSKKLKDIFIDEKIPKNERDEWPIITDGNGNIIWLIGLRKGQIEHTSKGRLFIKLIYGDDTI